MSTIARILAFIRPRAALAWAALACGFAVAGTSVALAWLLGPLVARVLEGAALVDDGGSAVALSVAGLAAALVAIAVVRAGAVYGQQVLGARLGQSVVRQLRETMYARLLAASPSTWTGRRHGELASRITDDSAKVQVLVASAGLSAAFQLVTLASLAALAASLSPWLAVVALAGLPAIGAMQLWLGRRVRAAYRGTQARAADLAALAAELARTAPVIAAYGAEHTAQGAFVERSAGLEAEVLRAQRVSALAVPIAQIVGALAVCAALILAGDQLADGAMSAETFVSFFAAVALMYRPVHSLAASLQGFAAGLGALDRVDEVLGLPVEHLEPEGATALEPLSRELRMRGVRFAYRPDEPVLDGVDLTVRPGESIAIVGSSGQGKTTLLGLMLGLLRADAGEVSIDDAPVGRCTPRSWRAQFAWVTQDPLLFAGTLVENVALADPEPDEARATEALRRAGAEALLAEGLDRVVAEGGRDLSGGQRQRVCIARALYRDAPVLLFDEATSSLDGPSERAIAETLESLMAERTVVVVSHRLQTVQRADRVVVIDGGRVVESGSPSSLLKTGGRFSELFGDGAPLSRSR